jgi:hypothetical protein
MALGGLAKRSGVQAGLPRRPWSACHRASWLSDHDGCDGLANMARDVLTLPLTTGLDNTGPARNADVLESQQCWSNIPQGTSMDKRDLAKAQKVRVRVSPSLRPGVDALAAVTAEV